MAYHEDTLSVVLKDNRNFLALMVSEDDFSFMFLDGKGNMVVIPKDDIKCLRELFR